MKENNLIHQKTYITIIYANIFRTSSIFSRLCFLLPANLVDMSEKNERDLKIKKQFLTNLHIHLLQCSGYEFCDIIVRRVIIVAERRNEF